MLKKVVLVFVNFLEQSDVLENSFSFHKVVAKVPAENYSNYLKLLIFKYIYYYWM